MGAVNNTGNKVIIGGLNCCGEADHLLSCIHYSTLLTYLMVLIIYIHLSCTPVDVLIITTKQNSHLTLQSERNKHII